MNAVSERTTLAPAQTELLGGRKPKQARKLASRLAAERAPATRELRSLLDDRTSLASNYLSALLVLAIVALMVFKPGAPHS